MFTYVNRQTFVWVFNYIQSGKKYIWNWRNIFGILHFFD